ncbi:U-box domain-containing protein 35 [Camellia lanceoleosa]|nr:U-box domain-containing protein 35 [Camellia lanceoleosa]
MLLASRLKRGFVTLKWAQNMMILPPSSGLKTHISMNCSNSSNEAFIHLGTIKNTVISMLSCGPQNSQRNNLPQRNFSPFSFSRSDHYCSSPSIEFGSHFALPSQPPKKFDFRWGTIILDHLTRIMLGCRENKFKKIRKKEIEMSNLSFNFIFDFPKLTTYHMPLWFWINYIDKLEILSRIRHPHLLILLGACPDYGSLVYEYMENGSLEDRLLRKNNTPPIPWFERYRISWEVTSALVFLHNSNPQPIIHRDLKPANILLDRNFVSKIGDVELSKMLESDPSVISTMCKDTGLVGTLSYIDLEYQRTGLISPKSDVYAFGMVILQLLTAKPAVALAHVVEIAVDDGNFADLLDLEAGNWPIEETKELAVLGLKCMELRRRDRPDLRDQVLPALEILKEFADRAQGMASNAQPAPPNHFICPILQPMGTLTIAKLYAWLEENDKSSMTNLLLLTRNLIPNYTLLSAIRGWKSGEQWHHFVCDFMFFHGGVRVEFSGRIIAFS